MPNRKMRARRRHGGLGTLLPALIVLVALVAAALVVLLVNSDPLRAKPDPALPYGFSTGLQFAEANDATPAPLVLGVTATPVPTATPEPEEDAAEAAPDAEADAGSTELVSDADAPAAEPTPAAALNRLVPTPYPGDYFLPVFDRALRTPDDRAMIAIIIDGCDDPVKMTTILTAAARYGAKLTLFPTGDALMKLGAGFRTCVTSLGYEMENTTYDADKKDYSLSSGELALQIWRQSIATSYAVTRDYQQHFYRPNTPQSVYDQRTHFFIRKLGFLGVASYTYSYKDHDLDFLVSSLENGNIYQFDMTDASLALFESFLGEANRKGYKMATMNELFELDGNAIGGALTINQQTLPEMTDYVPTYYDLKLNYRTNAVYSLQAKLMELGYLTAPEEERLVADGIYGGDTSVAVSKFQAKVGLVATGNADVETQQKLFSPDAPLADAP